MTTPKAATPRGIRNHNPGNIRRSRHITWQGQAEIQGDASFVQFESPVWGIRALARLLLNYDRLHGCNTVAAIIERYAPKAENETDRYIEFVCSRLEVRPEQKLHLKSILPELVEAIIAFENGRQPYSKALILEGVLMA